MRKELSVVSETNSNVLTSNDGKIKKSPSITSINSLSSPQDSSFSTGSPLDTSVSISDSFCGLQQRTDVEIYGFPSELDYSMSEPDSQHKYLLHRIEEESEQNGDVETGGMVTSQTLDSIKSIFSHSNQIDSQCNIFIPHSISQQIKL
uniref:Uncharacterized protein n=1 Tax=Setaria digitata TaxID=48799 RepID=A0A915Q0I3_9BILA